MAYRAILESRPETVQDLEVSAQRRLDEARTLRRAGKHHTAIYIAGLSAEMYLKTACFSVDRARLTDPVVAHIASLKNKYKWLLREFYEMGHGLWFWSQVLLDLRRRRFGKFQPPKHFHRVTGSLYSDWFVAMRYRPGTASADDSARMIANVEWLAANHLMLRR